MDQTTLLILAQTAAAFVTAVATAVLCWATVVLARETRVMAARGAEPHVVVTLEPSRWAIHFFEMHIMNAGNAAAYEITISFSPPLPERGTENWLPIERVSALRPGQEIVSSIGRYEAIKDQAYEVIVTWKRRAGAATEQNAYTLSPQDFGNYNELGGDPMVKLVRAVEKMQNSMK